MEAILSSPVVAAIAGFVIGGMRLSSLSGKGPSAGAAVVILAVVAGIVAILGGLVLLVLHSMLPALLTTIIGQSVTFASAFLVGVVILTFWRLFCR